MRKKAITTIGPDFLIVLDEAYANFASIGLKNCAHFHPKSKVFLYDLTPQPSDGLQSLSRLHENVQYIHWPGSRWLKNGWVDTLTFSDFHYNFKISDRFKHLSRILRYKLFGRKKEGWGELDKKEYVRKKKHFMHLCSQRTVICQDCLERTDKHLVFIDADAFVWRSLDPVFRKDFDVALTLRRLNDIKIGFVPGIKSDRPIPYKVINAGVLYFKNNDRARRFVSLWTDKILSIRDFALDQTALAQLLLDADAHSFEGYEKDIKVGTGGDPVIIKLLPCEPYNNFYIRENLTFESEAEDTYIAHFKGCLHKQEYYSSLKKLAENHIRGKADS